MMEKGEENGSDIEEFFPKNKQEIINKNIANYDPQTIHDKIEKYEELDSDQRYSFLDSGAKLFGTYPSYCNSSGKKESPS